MAKLLPILLLTAALGSCSPKGQAIKDLQYAQVQLRDQAAQLESAQANLSTIQSAITSGGDPVELTSLAAQTHQQVTAALTTNQTLVGTLDRTVGNVSQLKDPEPKWLAALRYGAIILGSILVAYVLFRFVGPLVAPLLALVPALIPKPKRDIATIAAKVSDGDLPPEHLVTAVRSDPTANAVYKRQRKKSAGQTKR